MVVDRKKHIYTFLITAIVFTIAVLASSYFSQKRINEIESIKDRIAVDILASEAQFSLLSELSCHDISSSFLNKELSNLGDRLSHMEENRGLNNEEVLQLKKHYSLLQIKDFLLMQKMKERCDVKILSIIYFYSNKGDCPDCQKAGFVLTRLRQDYPELRVYSFDYNLDLSALQTLISIYGIKNELPALLIDEKAYYGFKSIDEIKEILPALKEIDQPKDEEEILKINEAATTEEN